MRIEFWVLISRVIKCIDDQGRAARIIHPLA